MATPQTPKTGLVVTFAGSVVLRALPKREITGSQVDIIRFEDSPANKKVVAFTNGAPGIIQLWTGSAYDTIGDWTSADVVARIHELFGS